VGAGPEWVVVTIAILGLALAVLRRRASRDQKRDRAVPEKETG
jgi:hypothetical protein